jgi:hypothetical protein
VTARVASAAPRGLTIMLTDTGFEPCCQVAVLVPDELPEPVGLNGAIFEERREPKESVGADGIALARA